MKGKYIWMVIGVVVLFFIANSIYLNRGPGLYDDFATCLTESDLTMYGTSWCSYCNDQKELFGKSFKLVDFVDCDKNKDTCTIEGVKSYPTWKINGELMIGLKSLEELSELSGCILN